MTPLEIIIQNVARRFHFTVDEMRSPGRSQPLCFARQLAMYLARRITGLSYPQIGSSLGRDHATVIHACRMIAWRIEHGPAFGRSVKNLEREIIEREKLGVEFKILYDLYRP